MKNQTDSTSIQPTRWFRDRLWREPFLRDRERATEVREALVKVKIYPRYDLASNDNLAVMEANYRAALPDMIAALDRTDLAAVTDVVRLLAITPRSQHLFNKRRRSRRRSGTKR